MVDANNSATFIWVVTIVLSSSFIIPIFVVCLVAVNGSRFWDQLKAHRLAIVLLHKLAVVMLAGLDLIHIERSNAVS